jgi:hypothetical protein
MHNNVLLSVAVFIVLIFCCFVNADLCSKQTTCASCVTQMERCAWCTQTAQCVHFNESCYNTTDIYFMGSPRKNYLIDSDPMEQEGISILRSCPVRYETEKECVVGMDYAKVYTQYSLEIRDLREGGLPEQPILPLTQEFLDANVAPFEPYRGKINLYSRDLENNFTVVAGAYFINPANNTRFIPRLISLYPVIRSYGFMANVSLSGSNMIVKKNSNGELLLHYFTGSMGIDASPGFYDVGMILGMQSLSNNATVCMFYKLPKPIRARTVYLNMLVSPDLYIGIPFYLLVLLILIIFAKNCPFSNTQNNVTIKSKNILRQELLDVKDIEIDQIVKERYPFSFKWFLSLNSTKVLRQSGFRGYYWWKFYRRMILIVGIFVVITLIPLLPIHIIKNLKFPYYPDFALLTVGSIKPGSKILIIHFFDIDSILSDMYN